jgi:hypothetical protein
VIAGQHQAPRHLDPQLGIAQSHQHRSPGIRFGDPHPASEVIVQSLATGLVTHFFILSSGARSPRPLNCTVRYLDKLISPRVKAIKDDARLARGPDTPSTGI